jgi:hypothetical protein
MRAILKTVMIILVACGAGRVQADTHYVAHNGQTETPPYTNGWASAASNIQDAVNAAVANDTVLIGPGRYTVPTNGVFFQGYTNVVTIDKALTLRSSNGIPESVSIDGEGLYRGIFITNNISTPNLFVVSGITVTNAYTNGIRFYSSSTARSWPVVVENCVVVDTVNGPGIFDFQSYRTIIISNSVIRHNSGGGISVSFYTNIPTVNAQITDCIIENNLGPGLTISTYAQHVDPPFATSTISRCRFSGNSSAIGGGISCGAGKVTLNNSLVCNNTAAGIGGGIYQSSANGSLNIDNCTIVSNLSTVTGPGGLRSLGPNPVVNSIIYSNYFNSAVSDFGTISGTILTNCCTSSTNGIPGTGNITNNPQLVNFKPAKSSPCLNSGLNQAWMEGAVDLAGNPRRDRSGPGIVDMGAYEYRYEVGTIVRIH